MDIINELLGQQPHPQIESNKYTEKNYMYGTWNVLEYPLSEVLYRKTPSVINRKK